MTRARLSQLAAAMLVVLALFAASVDARLGTEALTGSGRELHAAVSCCKSRCQCDAVEHGSIFLSADLLEDPFLVRADVVIARLGQCCTAAIFNASISHTNQVPYPSTICWRLFSLGQWHVHLYASVLGLHSFLAMLHLPYCSSATDSQTSPVA